MDNRSLSHTIVNHNSLWYIDENGSIGTNVDLMNLYIDNVSEDGKTVKIKGVIDNNVNNLELTLNQLGYYQVSD